MLMKKIAKVMLLASLPLLSLPSLAVEKVVPKPATTMTAAKESGKLNINTATLTELTSLKGIGEKKAQAIIDYREKQGKFTSVDQLEDVDGIGPATVEANRMTIMVK